ncbi:uncharacterized protein TRIADDRAFT_54809 [Trichoplax adhaerens]|uniref:Uncharacterized protein n=1 Tax=Trichoplax adhaerens TaxID=10228 RepID=B3RT22_TRIAD|nr:hypothetical protein TRIADDRAFT_54809 [Trichoplax adhaerens]EDV27151.1 hypothetical protein TRIADDRAFT_54809 [Trichoplax adhaerens]|eukprot:XP_002111147.1 hypothetical protein TRIADDRAFT_54809 [Trichoplax adhaerens]
MAEESVIREIIQATFPEPKIRNNGVKLNGNNGDATTNDVKLIGNNDNAITQNGIANYPVVGIEIEQSINLDLYSSNLDRKDGNLTVSGNNITWGKYHGYKSSNNHLRRLSAHLNTENFREKNVPSIQELCKSVNKIYFRPSNNSTVHTRIRDESLDSRNTNCKHTKVKNNKDYETKMGRLHKNINGLAQERYSIHMLDDKSESQKKKHDKSIINRMIGEDSYFSKIRQTSCSRKYRRDTTWEQSKAKKIIFNSQLLAQAFDCDNLFHMLQEIEHNNHLLDRSMVRIQGKSKCLNNFVADGIEFDDEEEMRTYLNKMPRMAEMLRKELEFIKKQHTKIRKDSASAAT